MNFKIGRFFTAGIFVVLGLVIADQYTKWLVLEKVLRVVPGLSGFGEWFTTHQPLQYFIDQQENYHSVTLLPFLNFVMVWNQGVSFGMFDEGGEGMRLILIGLAVLISMLMAVWMALADRKCIAFGAALVIGGAIGNIIDRIRFGAVADFVDVHVAGYHWPAFNLADSAIVIGAGLLILDQIVHKDDKQTEG